MPLLIALGLLAVVLVLAVVLGLVGLLRRPFVAPAWQPVLPALLAVRAGLLVLALGAAALVVAWRQPDGLGALALGTVGGLALGAASGASARLEATRLAFRQRPRRVFVVVLALAVLARVVAGMVGGALQATLPPLAGLLLGYPLAHALALRLRARALRRLHATP